jgi:hypothetical protein
MEEEDDDEDKMTIISGGDDDGDDNDINVDLVLKMVCGLHLHFWFL